MGFLKFIKSFSWESLKTNDINMFIEVNRNISLTIITFFYIFTRLLSILTNLIARPQIDILEYSLTMAIHITFLIALFMAVFLLRNGNEKLAIVVITLSAISGFVFFFMKTPENMVVLLLSLFVRFIFIQMIGYLILHNIWVNLGLFLVSCGITLGYRNSFIESNIALDEQTKSFILIILIYGLVMLILFFSTLLVERNRVTRFIMKLLYVDYHLDLSNEKQLSLDFKHLVSSADSTIFIGIYITNLLSLNKKVGYRTTQFELVKKIEELKILLEPYSDIYKWEGPVFIISTHLQGKVLDELADSIEQLFIRNRKYKDLEIRFKIKLLATVYPNDGKNVERLLDNLQSLKYSHLRTEATKAGMVWFNEEIYKVNQREFRLEKDIYDAVKDKKIQIMIQPKIDLNSERVMGGEVLSRWYHESYGWVSPDEFIDIIEYEGLMDAFTQLILKKTENVLRTIKAKGARSLVLAINISASSVISGYISKLITEKLTEEEKGLIRGMELELTESLLLELNDESQQFIHQLKEFGCYISIDDFGTGFSNFEYLQKIQFDILKIDKRFISQMLASDRSKLLVEAMIKMAHTLGAKVVAEGVETLEQKEELAKMECDFIQGYYYAKPMTPDEFIEYAVGNQWRQ